jgi:acetyl esterase/lipase
MMPNVKIFIRLLLMKKFSRLLVLLACSFVTVPVGVKLVSQARAQELPAGTQRDVQYGEAGGEKLLLDIYGADANVKRPALLFIHGGAWKEGSRKDLAGAAITFSRQGYVCFSLGYRLIKGETNRYPAQIDDVQRAVRWVRAHSTEYGVLPDKIGALGMSAGGHLVALLGTMDTRDNSDPALAAYSSRVQCVVDLYGPTDFTSALLPANRDAMTDVTAPGAQLVQSFLPLRTSTRKRSRF